MAAKNQTFFSIRTFCSIKPNGQAMRSVPVLRLRQAYCV
jgi:hypothetical protein